MTGLSIDLCVADINSSSGWISQHPGLGCNVTPASGFNTPASIPKRKHDDDVEVDQSLATATGIIPHPTEPVDMKKQLAIAEGIIKEFFATQELLL